MPLDDLDSPLRLTWDLCPRGRAVLSESELLQVAERLLDAGIFYLILDERPLLHPGLGALLQRLAAGSCQVGLVLGDAAVEWERLAALDPSCALFIDAGCWLGRDDGINGVDMAFSRLREQERSASLLWVPQRGELRQIYPLLEICRRWNIPRFKLPNRKIGANSGPFDDSALLLPADIEELARMLQKQPIDVGRAVLEVHDLFLWELLFPGGDGERSEYGGCQAGNSLGHIAANGDVWPCSSWTQVLGNLLNQDLLTLWESPLRSEVRAEVAGEPEECLGCRDFPVCFGGCRGLARSCRGSGSRDPLCSGRRC